MNQATPLPADAFDLTAAQIADRFRWAREAGHPAYLWPDVPMPAWRAALQELERVTRAVLRRPPGESRPDGGRGRGASPVLRADDGLDVRALGIAAYTSGMGPLLGRWIERGRLSAAPAATELLALHLHHARRRADRLQRALDHALDVLDAVGVKPLVIKGAHTGRAYFPESGVRPAADIDLVISPGEAEAVEGAFARAGYQAAGRLTRPYRTEWRPPASPARLHSLELVHADDPFEIDLHASLDRDFFGVRTLRFERAGAIPRRPWPDRPNGAAVLGQPHLTAYLAAHASEGLHGLTLLRLCELVRVIRQDVRTGALRWPDLHDLLADMRALRFVYPAFVLAERLAPETVDAGFLAAVDAAATPRMRRVVEPLRPADAQRLEALSLRERFMWARGPVEHLRRLAYMLWPARAGGSVTRLAAIYTERIRRVVRGRVGWSGASR